MKEDNVLKKEFKKSDVERIRNLVNKDYTKGTRTQIGYERDNRRRKEGEVWEEAGKTWTIKDGLKQNITKLDKAKEYVKVPITCPRCGGPMRHHLAKKMYRIHGFCFDPCTVEYEATLRRAGLYKKYEEQMIKGNIGTFVKDMENWINDFSTNTNSYVTEDGVIEDWEGSANNRHKEIQEQIKSFTSHIRKHLQ